MPTNEAAWLVAKHARLQLGPAPYPQPGAGEIVVRNHAVAVNPVDWMKPFIGDLAFGWIKYPFVLGSDLAGEVVAIGTGVSEVRVGDRVLAMAAGSVKARNRAAEGAFQTYSVVLPHLTTIIPDTVSYAEAAVVPLGAMTAACGLFQKDLLALDLPTLNPATKDQWVIIWGGSTSVGCNAIQLAVAAGYSVVTTASPKNFGYVESLGAAYAFDYKSPSVADDIVAALQGKNVVGALTIGAGSVLICLDILPKCQGRKFIANCSADVPFGEIKGSKITLGAIVKLLGARLRANGEIRRKSRQHGVTAKFFDASSVVGNEIGPAIFRDYLGPALAGGRFRPAPRPRIVGQGLGAVQTAFDAQRKGVSAEKIVVELP